MANFRADLDAKIDLSRRNAIVAAVALGVFLAFLTFGLRGSFWTSADYGMLSLSHAIHLEWRVNQWQNYPAPGLAGHPGIPFYFASWLAVALVVPSFSPGGFDRFSEIVANAEGIYVANQMIAIAVIVLSSYAFFRIARKVVSTRVALVALGMWLASTYQVLLTATSLSIETFAFPLNVLFLWMLVRLATDARISATNCLLAGLVAATGYLLKLPYLYVAVGLGAAILASVLINRRGVLHSVQSIVLMVDSFVLCVAGVGYAVLGEVALNALLNFHHDVIFHSGFYGSGAAGLVESSHAKAAWASLMKFGAFASWVALMLGFICVVLSLRCWISKKGHPAEIVIGVGAGVAALFSALGVLKHFIEHYAAGVAPTLATAVIALFLLVRNSHPKTANRLGLLCAILLAFGLPHSVYFAAAEKANHVARRIDSLSDRRQLEEILQAHEGNAVFTYHVPMREFGEGFILHYSGVPALQQEYKARDQARVSSYMQPKGHFRYVVLDKTYFPDVSAIRRSSNLDPVGSVAISQSNDDEIVEMRRSFVVIKPTAVFIQPP
jgi:hypothetical protein